MIKLNTKIHASVPKYLKSGYPVSKSPGVIKLGKQLYKISRKKWYRKYYNYVPVKINKDTEVRESKDSIRFFRMISMLNRNPHFGDFYNIPHSIKIFEGIIREVNLEDEYIVIESKIMGSSGRFHNLTFPFHIINRHEDLNISDVIQFQTILNVEGFVEKVYNIKVYSENEKDIILENYFETMIEPYV